MNLSLALNLPTFSGVPVAADNQGALVGVEDGFVHRGLFDDVVDRLHVTRSGEQRKGQG